MKSFLAVAALLVADLVTAAPSQAADGPADVPGPGAKELRWAELGQFHSEVEALAAGVSALDTARADVARVLADNRGFQSLSRREQQRLTAAHNRIVEVLELGAARRLQCARVTTLGSRMPQLRCYLAGKPR